MKKTIIIFSLYLNLILFGGCAAVERININKANDINSAFVFTSKNVNIWKVDGVPLEHSKFKKKIAIPTLGLSVIIPEPLKESEVIKLTRGKHKLTCSYDPKGSFTKNIDLEVDVISGGKYIVLCREVGNTAHLYVDYKSEKDEDAIFAILKDYFDENRFEKAAKYLEEKGNPNVCDSQGNTLLEWAIFYKNDEFAERVIQMGIDLNGEFYYVNIFKYCLHQKMDKAALSLSKNKFFFNTKDKDGKTPILNAIHEGNVVIALELIINGADINIADKYGRSPLFYAVERNNYTMAKELIIQGADVYAVNIMGETIFDIAEKNNKKEILELIEKYRRPPLNGKIIECQDMALKDK